MKYYLIAGEASGDLHASHLMQSLKETDTQAEFRFFGGDLMARSELSMSAPTQDVRENISTDLWICRPASVAVRIREESG